MKLLITGTLLVVVAAAANLDVVRQGEQIFERTPNNNLVQVKYIDNSRFTTSQPFHRQNQRAQVRSFSGNNQGFFSNQDSQFDQQGGRFQQHQRNQFTTNLQNQRNRFSDNSQHQRNQFSGNLNRHSSNQQFSFNNNQHRNPHLVDVTFVGEQQNRNAQNQGQFLSRGFNQNQNQQSRDFFNNQPQHDRQFQDQNREFFGQNQQNRDFFNQPQQNEFLNQNNRNFASQQNNNNQFFRNSQNQGEQVFHVTTSGQHQLQRQIGGSLSNQEHFSRSFGINNNNERREVSGHIQTDAGNILGVFQSFFVPASATLAEGLISSSFTCENYGRGFYTDPDNNCRYFHVCSPVRDPVSTQSSNNYYRFTFQCGTDEQFDQERMTCVRTELTNACPNARSFFSFSQDRSRNLFTSFPDSSFHGDYFYIGNNGIVTGIRRK
ncbi:uncharacterized protein LOC143029750 [Oratosquilla oratoria]|uniref:uncharacterized protein LOC143029750 n=1 Tax=Oratosquilla oratoria TaxID=337810 RepID=UPI003F75D3F7